MSKRPIKKDTDEEEGDAEDPTKRTEFFIDSWSKRSAEQQENQPTADEIEADKPNESDGTELTVRKANKREVNTFSFLRQQPTNNQRTNLFIKR